MEDGGLLGSLDGGGNGCWEVIASLEAGTYVIAVHVGDYFQWNFLRACGRTLADAGAVAEVFGIHLRNHAEGSALAFGFALGKGSEVRDLCPGEERR